jgi:nucleotide-binding universal stress UspA family protein
MDYRTILVDLTTERSAATNVPVAINLADQFDATCIGLHVMSEPDPASWTPSAESRAAQDRVRAVFQRLAGGDARMKWTESEGGPEELFVAAALTVDLAVVAQRQAEGNFAPDLADRLIMEAGVPVLMLPHQAATEFGRTILVGWNGSREATRAVHEALPFLVRAQRVVVCAVGDVAMSSVDAAAEMLRRHGARVEPEAMSGPEEAASEALLRSTLAHGADLLVIGSYGQTRVREFLFGGVTRHMLHRAPLPVLFGS